MMEVAASRVGKNVHLRSLDGAQETFGLIAVRVELTVDGGNHAVDLETFAPGHIEGAVGQDLDLEPLEKMVVLSVLVCSSVRPVRRWSRTPSRSSPDATSRPREWSRDHRPRVSAPAAGSRHGLERRLAVGVAGVPVKGPAQALGMEILGSGVEGFDHFQHG